MLVFRWWLCYLFSVVVLTEGTFYSSVFWCIMGRSVLIVFNGHTFGLWSSALRSSLTVLWLHSVRLHRGLLYCRTGSTVLPVPVTSLPLSNPLPALLKELLLSWWCFSLSGLSSTLHPDMTRLLKFCLLWFFSWIMLLCIILLHMQHAFLFMSVSCLGCCTEEACGTVLGWVRLLR